MKNYEYPSEVGLSHSFGFATDLPIIEFANYLILYDKIILNIDPFNLSALFVTCKAKELIPLFENHRIKFAPNTTNIFSPFHLKSLDNESKNEYLVEVEKGLTDIILPDDNKVVVKQIMDNIIFPNKLPQNDWEEIEKLYVNELWEKARIPQLSFLIYKNDPVFYPNILSTGIRRISDFVGSNIRNIALDREIFGLLDICYSNNLTKYMMNTSLNIITENLLNKLHSMNNLPLLDRNFLGSRTDKEIVDIIQSDESYKLREWLKANIKDGVDVRDIYFETLRNLPSKKKWVSWMRFGVTSSISTLISLLIIPEPITSTTLGLAIGALDNYLGEKTSEKTMNPYHPQEWTSYIMGKL